MVARVCVLSVRRTSVADVVVLLVVDGAAAAVAVELIDSSGADVVGAGPGPKHSKCDRASRVSRSFFFLFCFSFSLSKSAPWTRKNASTAGWSTRTACGSGNFANNNRQSLNESHNWLIFNRSLNFVCWFGRNCPRSIGSVIWGNNGGIVCRTSLIRVVIVVDSGGSWNVSINDSSCRIKR